MAAFALSPAASYLTGADDPRRRRRPAVAVSTVDGAPVLVACAHGTRNPTGRRLIAELALAARALRPGPGDHGRLRRRPAAHRRRRRRGARRRRGRPAVVVPLLLSGGYHVHVDIAGAVAGAAGAVAARPLGPDPRLVEVLRDRLVEAGADPRDPLTAVVVAAAGSSDPRSVADVEDTADLLQRSLGGAGDHRLRLGGAADRARRRRRRSPGRCRAGRRRRLPAGAGALPRQARRGRRRRSSPRRCCRTTGSPPSCSTATTPRWWQAPGREHRRRGRRLVRRARPSPDRRDAARPAADPGGRPARHRVDQVEDPDVRLPGQHRELQPREEPGEPAVPPRGRDPRRLPAPGGRRPPGADDAVRGRR